MKLAIISHTEHFRKPDGTLVGWGPTVNEINHLLEVFDEIYHVAMLHKGEAPASALPYVSSKIQFMALPVLGGKTIGAKLNTIWHAPKVLSIVQSTLKEVDYFQLRTPTGIGVYLIPYLTLFCKKKGWFKYAGNWNQEQPPFGYRLQRFLLKKQKRPVTINGQWPKQPEHCISFENPCLTNEDLVEGQEVSAQKRFDGPLHFCFVGRLEAEKGVGRIIAAMTGLSTKEKQRIGEVHFVGEGENLPNYKALAVASGVAMVFHGALSRSEVFAIYKESHVFMLPTTASEGFPKVIAEAMNFGCIPFVSSVSSISQYIATENGFVLENTNHQTIIDALCRLLELSNEGCQALVRNGKVILHRFSYDYYNKKIASKIMGDQKD